ncbi:MAG: type IX secretion system membrane protein PorP/SprF, partial [Bacteroidetes bacterium]
MVKHLPFLLLGIFLSLELSGQDIHYTQFMNTPLHVNPGLTGVFSGNTRIGATYRSQWRQVPVNYRTFSAYADHKYTCGRENDGFWSSGIALNYDRAGDANLTWANLGLYGSYTQPLSERTLVTIGATLGLGQRRFDTDNLRSDSQFDEGVGIYDPGLSIGENFSRQSLIFLDMGLGANLRWQARQRHKTRTQRSTDKRSHLDIGVGVHHLNRPDMS